jgi:hypothetical protein
MIIGTARDSLGEIPDLAAEVGATEHTVATRASWLRRLLTP